MQRRSWILRILIGLLTTLTATPALATGAAQPTSTPAPPAVSSSPAQTPFSDMAAETWALPALTKLLAVGAVSPDPEGLFRPNDPVTRAELAKLLLGARRVQPLCNGLFADAPCTSWAGPYVETAYRLGVLDLVGAEAIYPDGLVTREELMTYGIRAASKRFAAGQLDRQEVTGILLGFSDRSLLTKEHQAEVALAVKLGLFNGYADGTLRPTAWASRAEAAVLASRLLQEGAVLTAIGDRSLPVKASWQMKATAYSPGEPGVGTVTYSGMAVRTGTVAVDPTKIPLGSWVFVDGWGYGIAADTGGAIKGARIDLFTWNYAEAALHFGVQNRTVWLLG
ncbi:MAG TPA: S-layer homology domain-containing protein [Symbiobacteriaceae bacterium]|nr:S-layer homology domain-containing protein [Symbiobacteriaceae bacterium]